MERNSTQTAAGDRRNPDQAPAARGRSFRGFAAKLALLALAGIVAAGLAELLVRVARPGFPGFKTPQVEHRPADGLGFVMIPNQVAYTTASRATINADGFRGPEIRSPRPAGSLRVMCLGDSITFGVGVGDDDPYPRQLERMLQRARGVRDPEVINAGVQRYFTYQEVDQLRMHGARIRPDVVTLGVYSNDIDERPAAISARDYENEREQAATSFRRRLPFIYGLAKNSAALELAKNVYLSRTERENFVSRMFKGTATERDERRWRGFEREVAAFAALADELGFVPVVVAVPARSQISGDLPNSQYPSRVLEIARRAGVQAISPTAPFKNSLSAGNDPYLPWDDHLSPVGHRLVAEALLEHVERAETAARASGAPER